MHSYKLVIQYDGSPFLGFQIQPEVLKTIQGNLNKALSELSKSNSIKTIGSGRTDAGVHANGQVIKAEIPIFIDPLGLQKGLNSKLPKEIRVIACSECDDQFHPIFDAKSKEYHYLFSNKVLHPALNKYVTSIRGELNIQKMDEACRKFVGEFEFLNYYCEGTPVKSYKRKIFHCGIDSLEPHIWNTNSNIYRMKISGSGFLKQMVRLIFGAIAAHGQDKISLEDIETSLSRRVDDKLSAVAPPNGLYLHSVDYVD